MYSQPNTVRSLKRRANSSDSEDTPVKQARVSVQNTHARRLPPLRRSDTQALDINATKPILERLSDNQNLVQASFNTEPRGEDHDMAGSTDEESQDEAGAWDRRAKAHRHAALFKRPREPAPRMKPRAVAKTVSEVALLDGNDSDSDSDSEVIRPLPVAGNTVHTRAQKLMALRAGRTSVGSFAPTTKPLATSSAKYNNAGTAMVQPYFTSPSTSTLTTTTTTKVASRTSTRSTVMASRTVAHRVEEINSYSTSNPIRPSRNRTPRLALATQPAAVARPQRQNSRTRQAAIAAIAGTTGASLPPVPTRQHSGLGSTLVSAPSAILRRSRRLQLAAPELQ